jgi:hypothetical protein
MLKTLFHYTSINNLALILKSKSIRFGRLDKVNDPTEGESSDFQSLAPYIFISCWTKHADENLALWNMYTPQMRGVRIELPLPIFESYKIGTNENVLVSENEFLDNERNLFILPGKNIPEEVIYTDDQTKLKPKIETNMGLKIKELGIHKRKIWSFEEEYRYRLDIYPTDSKVVSKNFLDKYDHLIGVRPPSIDGYLRAIGLHSFSKMKIRTSPKLIEGDAEIIDSLVDKFNASATLEQSTLKGLVR